MKSKFKGLKQQLSRKITEKLLNDVTKRRHMSEAGHGMKAFSQNNPFDVFNIFKFDQLIVKNMFKSLPSRR